MTVQDYEQQGGFREELDLVRKMGQTLTTLETYLEARPHRTPERESIAKLKCALDEVRREIVITRNMQ